MSSTKREGSIATSPSIFIPSWVKSKLDNSGFDPSALSPPTNDGEFFYVKFPKAEKVETSQFRRIEEVIAVKEQAFANHTDSCKQFIPIIKDSVLVVKPKITKPMGVDDGFKGEGAACGTSIVAVAQQMVANRSEPPVRGFTTDDARDQPSNVYLSKRRNSKSLPASPLASPETSPRTRRKTATSFALQNRFNLGSIVARATVDEKEEDINKKYRSNWILSSLFSHSEKSGLTIKKKENSVAAQAESSKGSADDNESSGLNKANLNVAVKSSDMSRKVYLQKRSEIRELNFISPVSM